MHLMSWLMSIFSSKRFVSGCGVILVQDSFTNALLLPVKFRVGYTDLKKVFLFSCLRSSQWRRLCRQMTLLLHWRMRWDPTKLLDNCGLLSFLPSISEFLMLGILLSRILLQSAWCNTLLIDKDPFVDYHHQLSSNDSASARSWIILIY